MKNLLLLYSLFLFLALPGLCQDRVLATSQGQTLTERQVKPALDLLTFLAQSELTANETERVLASFANGFQRDPSSILSALKDFKEASDQFLSTSDVDALAKVRQMLITVFFEEGQNQNTKEALELVQVFFAKVPVLAYDPKTQIVLTQPDLMASMVLFQQLGEYQGTTFSDEQLKEAALQAVSSFESLDEETQRTLASGALLLSFLEANLDKMSPAQQTNLASQYRTTIGGPPGKTRSDSENAAFDALSQFGPSEQTSLLTSLKAAGGDTDFWSAIQAEKSNP